MNINIDFSLIDLVHIMIDLSVYLSIISIIYMLVLTIERVRSLLLATPSDVLTSLLHSDSMSEGIVTISTDDIKKVNYYHDKDITYSSSAFIHVNS